MDKVRFHFIIMIYLSLFTSLMYGKSKSDKIDSLRQIITSNSVHDTIKADVYYKLAACYYNTNIDTFKLYADKELFLSKSINYKRGEANALFLQGAYYRMTRNLDSAQIKMSQSLDIFLDLKDTYSSARCYNDLGSICRYNNKIDSALYFFEKAKEMFIQCKKNGGLAATYVNLAIIQRAKGEFSNAIKKYEKAIELYASVNDFANCALAYRNLGTIYKQLEDFSQGIDCYIEAVRFSQKSNNKRTEAIAYHSISDLFFRQEKLTEALTYEKKSLQIANETNRPREIVISLNHLSSIYNKMDSLDQALKVCNRALQVNNKQLDKSIKAHTYREMANTYHKIGDIAKAEKYYKESLKFIDKNKCTNTLNSIGKFYFDIGKLKAAKEYFTWALQNAHKAHSFYNIRDAYKGLANSYEKLGDYKKSLSYFKQYQLYSDSAVNKKNSYAILRSTLGLKHQNEIQKIELEQEKRSLIAEKEKNKQVVLKNAFIVGFVFILVVSILIFNGFRRNKKRNKKLAKLNNEIKTQKELILSQNEELTTTNERLIELDQFKEAMTGMIVHDLKNPLNTIIHASSNTTNFTQKIRSAGKQMLNLVLNILDLQKYENSTMLVDLREEELNFVIKQCMEEVKLLCEEKNIQLQTEVKHQFKVLTEKEVLKRILVNLLTNAIKYSPNNDVITVRVIENMDQSKIRIEIHDNGTGIPKSEQSKIFDRFAQQRAKESGEIQSTGLGLAFCKMAVEAHDGKIGVESEVGKGACFWFTIPMSNISDTIFNQNNFLINKNLSLPQLTQEEILQINDSLDQLKDTKIYQMSRLNTILEDIDETVSENMKKWKEVMEKAIRTEDQKTFLLLINNRDLL